MSKARNLSKLQPDSSGALPSASIGTDAITSDKIAAGAIVDADVNSAAGIANTKIAGLGTLATVSPTGTPDSTKFLRGDNSWQTVAVTPTAVSDQNNTSTGYFDLPAGTTAQRPGSPTAGMIRYNTSNSQYEVYSGSSWQGVLTTGAGYSIEYLVIGGGGAGGAGYQGGGGGAGGMVSGSFQLASGVAYSVTIGAGGTAANNTAGSGNGSTFENILALGGGCGGGEPSGGGYNAQSGGSGGGGSWYGPAVGQPGAGAGGQGNRGGFGSSGGYAGGGGGGASAVGGDSNTGTSTGGAGGAGRASSISGSSVTYAGGGGGSYRGGNPGSGGSGGGGSAGNPGTAGTANTGGGGGAGQFSGGAAGGSGIVIIRYLGSQRGSGGTVTSSGGYTIHTFTTSGTYTA